jgi:hypothetical protein
MSLNPMVKKLLSWLLCLLLALPASVFGHLSLKTRVGGYPIVWFYFASSGSSQVLYIQQDISWFWQGQSDNRAKERLAERQDCSL